MSNKLHFDLNQKIKVKDVNSFKKIILKIINRDPRLKKSDLQLLHDELSSRDNNTFIVVRRDYNNYSIIEPTNQEKYYRRAYMILNDYLNEYFFEVEDKAKVAVEDEDEDEDEDDLSEISHDTKGGKKYKKKLSSNKRKTKKIRKTRKNKI